MTTDPQPAPDSTQPRYQFKMHGDEARRVAEALVQWTADHPGQPVSPMQIMRDVLGREPELVDQAEEERQRTAVPPPKTIGPFTLSWLPAAKLYSVGFTTTEGQTLAAVLSQDEVAKLAPMFDHVTEHLMRDETPRIDVRAACVDLIGRDPFEDVG
ncbi:hypothetical protein AB0B63_07295 [Micromonospora sp. NPDC049081]|uniref:hypothetical protein n=1 Tax=Micromonospora sp. NPDC049081 TaxID=3155150 RepID=UPI0033D907C1